MRLQDPFFGAKLRHKRPALSPRPAPPSALLLVAKGVRRRTQLASRGGLEAPNICANPGCPSAPRGSLLRILCLPWLRIHPLSHPAKPAKPANANQRH